MEDILPTWTLLGHNAAGLPFTGSRCPVWPERTNSRVTARSMGGNVRQRHLPVPNIMPWSQKGRLGPEELVIHQDQHTELKRIELAGFLSLRVFIWLPIRVIGELFFHQVNSASEITDQGNELLIQCLWRIVWNVDKFSVEEDLILDPDWDIIAPRCNGVAHDGSGSSIVDCDLD